MLIFYLLLKYVYIRTYIHTIIHTYIHTYTYIGPTYIYAYIHTHTYTHTNIHIYLHTHKYIQIFFIIYSFIYYMTLTFYDILFALAFLSLPSFISLNAVWGVPVIVGMRRKDYYSHILIHFTKWNEHIWINPCCHRFDYFNCLMEISSGSEVRSWRRTNTRLWFHKPGLFSIIFKAFQLCMSL